jgi:hypothetical protein
MAETGVVQKIHRWKPFTGRPVGRRKCRWEDYVRNGLGKVKLIKWTGQVQDRLKWKGIVGKTKTVQSCSDIGEEKEKGKRKKKKKKRNRKKKKRKNKKNKKKKRKRKKKEREKKKKRRKAKEEKEKEKEEKKEKKRRRK